MKTTTFALISQITSHSTVLNKENCRIFGLKILFMKLSVTVQRSVRCKCVTVIFQFSNSFKLHRTVNAEEVINLQSLSWKSQSQAQIYFLKSAQSMNKIDCGLNVCGFVEGANFELCWSITNIQNVQINFNFYIRLKQYWDSACR
jgi:hypothetical protein